MYIPESFLENRVPVLHRLIEQYALATLVTLNSRGLIASHIPMVLDPQPAPFGTLRGHVSRANPQWLDISTDVQALAIFSGPHHYISPSWYPCKMQTGRVVPTWNYAAVHAYGSLQMVHEPEWLFKHLGELVTVQETGSREPWKIEDAPADYISSMAKGIVGLELSIQRLEGKWKVSQNRSVADRKAVIRELEELGTPESNLMAKLIADRLDS